MSILNQIKNQLKQARLARDADKVVMISTFVGELERSFKDATDDQAIACIQKQIKNLGFLIAETQKNRPDVSIQSLLDEVEFLSRFLPRSLTEEEISKLVKIAVEQQLQLSEFMTMMKNEYASRYDSKNVVAAFNSAKATNDLH